MVALTAVELRHRRPLAFLLLCVCISAFCARGEGQNQIAEGVEATAGLLGGVTDANGAAVPNAKITITNEGSGLAAILPRTRKGTLFFRFFLRDRTR